jgi:hypothetical protein
MDIDETKPKTDKRRGGGGSFLRMSVVVVEV